MPGRSIEIRCIKNEAHQTCASGGVSGGERCLAVVRIVAEKRTGFRPVIKQVDRGSDSEKRIGIVTDDRKSNPVVSLLLLIEKFRGYLFPGADEFRDVGPGLRVRPGVASVAGVSRHGYGSYETEQSEGNCHATLNAMGESDEVVLWWQSSRKHVHMRFQSPKVDPRRFRPCRILLGFSSVNGTLVSLGCRTSDSCKGPLLHP